MTMFKKPRVRKSINPDIAEPFLQAAGHTATRPGEPKRNQPSSEPEPDGKADDFLGLRINAWERAKLDEWAEEEDRSVNYLVRCLIRKQFGVGVPKRHKTGPKC